MTTNNADTTASRHRLAFPLLCVLTVLLFGCTKAEVREWVDVDMLIPGQKNTPASVPQSGGRTAATLDSATEAERARATSVTNSGGRLGTTTVTLGAPAEAGFWLKTPLVSAKSAGVLRSQVTGKSVLVTLIPIEGPRTAGSRISLSAMRALELPLTALAEIDVSRAG